MSYVDDEVKNALGAIADATRLAELCGDESLALRLREATATLVAIYSGTVAVSGEHAELSEDGEVALPPATDDLTVVLD